MRLRGLLASNGEILAALSISWCSEWQAIGLAFLVIVLFGRFFFQSPSRVYIFTF